MPDPKFGGLMSRMSELWPRKRPPRTVYVGSYEDKLSRVRPMHLDPDDDQRAREDRQQEKAERNPHHGTMGGGGFVA
jgi:hypothetical protein